MNGERLVRYRFFAAWADQQEERWLEQMAAQGWHLVSGGIRFVFERGEPVQMRYRLDYRPVYPQGQGEYLSLFRDAGWEYVGDFLSWHYFRSPVSAAAPEIFTDTESRVAKYRSLLVLLALVLVMNLGVLPGVLDIVSARHSSPLVTAALAVQLCMLALLIYATVRIALHMRKIRQEHAAH